MSVLIDNNTKAIFQGFTGSQATMHAEQCVDYGTNIIAVSYTHLTLQTNREV